MSIKSPSLRLAAVPDDILGLLLLFILEAWTDVDDGGPRLLFVGAAVLLLMGRVALPSTTWALERYSRGACTVVDTSLGMF